MTRGRHRTADRGREETAAHERERLELLYQAGRRLSATLDLHEVFGIVREEMSRVAPNDSFIISAFDPQAQSITCTAFWLDGAWQDVGAFPSIPLEEEGRGTQSIVIRTGRPLLLNDYHAQQRTARNRYVVNSQTGEVSPGEPDDEDHTRSALIVPLTVGGTVQGAIQVMSFEAGAYTEDQLLMLEALAAHIASAVQNATLYERLQTELQERERAEAALAQVAAALRTQVGDTVTTMGAMVSMRDPYTAAHERRVTVLALAIAGELGLDEQRTAGLALAGDVHDIGKLAVPAEILTKPSRLSPAEFTLIREHPAHGRRILEGIRFEQPVAEIVAQHHERMDGSGYPAGLYGDQILLEARILALADVVEAMAHDRPYRPGLGLDAALAEARRGAGTLYDQDVVAACERVFAGGFSFVD